MMGDATGTGVSQQAGREIKLTVSLEESRMSSKLDQGIQAVPYVPPKQISCMFSQQIRGRWLMNRFYLNETSVSQCEPVEVYWDESAVSPVRVLGVIPQGQIFEFSSIGEAASMGMSLWIPDTGVADEIVWNTNIAAGTSFILAAFNSGPFGNGGSSALMTVGESSNSGCLDDSSPSSTPAAPVQTATGTKTSGPTRTGGGIKTVTAIATAQPSGAAG